MSDQQQEVPLIELLEDIPKDLRGEWEIQWTEDGRPTGHAMAPVGLYAHRAAARIAELEAEAAERCCPTCEISPILHEVEADATALADALHRLDYRYRDERVEAAIKQHRTKGDENNGL